jgi:hypothetical protein
MENLTFGLPKDRLTLHEFMLPFEPNRCRQVNACYETVMKAGGRDNGLPGVRSHYHPDYYGAFVLDPDGHNIEAVCHTPQ